MLTYIHKLIDKNEGSLSISDFMNAALYHRECGYYMNKLPLGKDSDFITAPEISQLFGEVVAVWIMHTWKKLEKPLKFSLVELGPGKGTLIHDIIRVTEKYSDFSDSVSIHLVEISSSLQKIQKEKLNGLDVNWHKDITNLPNQPTVFLANEFFDALPIDQFVYRNGEWYENRVIKQGTGVSLQCMALRLKNYSIPMLRTGVKTTTAQVTCKLQYLRKYASSIGMTKEKLFDGAVIEVSQIGIEMLKRLEEKIHNNKGAALIIDYGYVYPKCTSTLQSVKQHKYANFLENLGKSDITALVNFQALRASLKHVDCEILTQREFLYLFGIKERMQILIKNANDEQKNRIFGEFLRLTENMGTLFKAILIQHL